LADSLAEAIEHMKMDGAGPAGEDIFLPMSCLTISVSELGTFLKIDDSALVDVLVDLWDGQLASWGHKTRTNGAVEIKNPWLNIIGCTTPAWLKAHFPDHLIGGGLTSRIVFVYGDAKRKLIPYPDEVIPDAEYRDTEAKLAADLAQIALMQGPLTLSNSARVWGHKWYEHHWSTRPVHLASDRYSGYLSRKQTHIHKLAIVCSAARNNSMIITDDHLKEACALLEAVEPHMLKVFESIGVVNEAQHVGEMVAFVRTHGAQTSDELWRLVMNTMSQRDFEEALKAAVRGGMLNIVKKNGRPAVEAPALN
jgi:hypothetical protein